MFQSMHLKETRRYGQLCLVTAVILNGILLGLNLYLSGQESELAGHLADEGYYIVNNDAVQTQLRSNYDMQMILSIHQGLRKLARGAVTQKDYSQLLANEEVIEQEIDASLRRAVAGLYLLASDLPDGITPDQFFAVMSDGQLLALKPKFEETALAYIRDLKAQQVAVRGRLSTLRTIHSLILIMSTVLVLLGNVLLFAIREDP